MTILFDTVADALQESLVAHPEFSTQIAENEILIHNDEFKCCGCRVVGRFHVHNLMSGISVGVEFYRGSWIVYNCGYSVSYFGSFDMAAPDSLTQLIKFCQAGLDRACRAWSLKDKRIAATRVREARRVKRMIATELLEKTHEKAVLEPVRVS